MWWCVSRTPLTQQPSTRRYCDWRLYLDASPTWDTAPNIASLSRCCIGGGHARTTPLPRTGVHITDPYFRLHSVLKAIAYKTHFIFYPHVRNDSTFIYSNIAHGLPAMSDTMTPRSHKFTLSVSLSLCLSLSREFQTDGSCRFSPDWNTGILPAFLKKKNKSSLFF